MRMHQTDKTVEIEKNIEDDRHSFSQQTFSQQEREICGTTNFYRPYMGIAYGRDGKKNQYDRIKRVFDCVFSVAALLILCPILLAFMIVVFLEDPNGCPLFRQIRIGKNGKPFVIYKLRSMYARSDQRFDARFAPNEAKGKAFKMRNDPRVTKIGRLIRKFSIDELPQLINVIKGDMSIVGPRPPLPWEVAQYDAYERQRLAIRPGLTCYWQIFPGKHEISFEDWVALDIKYILDRNIKIDITLIFQTIAVVFQGNGE